MSSQILKEKLNFPRAYRQKRLDVAQWVLDNPETFPDLLRYCFDEKSELSYRATWILEFVCNKKLSLLFPHLDTFCKNLSLVKKDQAVRPLSKISGFLIVSFYKKKDVETRKNLSEENRKKITEACFDWLITNQKVACKVYAIESLYHLGSEFDWVRPELKTILEEGYSTHSAAFKARARFYLKKL